MCIMLGRCCGVLSWAEAGVIVLPIMLQGMVASISALFFIDICGILFFFELGYLFSNVQKT